MISLVDRIKQDRFIEPVSTWLDCIDPFSAADCAMSWARDSNAFVCSTGMPNGVPAIENQELNGAYYNSSIGVVELQVTKGMCHSSVQNAFAMNWFANLSFSAGYRLAAWLNLIATGDIGLSAAKGPQKREPLSYLPLGVTNEFSPAKLERRAFGHMC